MVFARIVVYCLVCEFAVWGMLMLWERLAALGETVTGESVYSSTLMRGLLVLIFLTPILVMDAAKFTHRLVGPLYRFRKTIQAMAADEAVELVHLRKGDMLQDMKDEFNAMLRLMEQKGYVLVKSPNAAEKAEAPVAVG
jgi:hypothetical protein